AGAKHLVLTHLIPPPGAPQQGPWKVPGGALTEADYRKAAQDGGFGRNVIVATDLASLRLPVKRGVRANANPRLCLRCLWPAVRCARGHRPPPICRRS